jgi:hypothetical protein
MQVLAEEPRQLGDREDVDEVVEQLDLGDAPVTVAQHACHAEKRN